MQSSRLNDNDPADWCEPVGGIKYRTKRPILWEIGRAGSGLVYAVPAGSVFDVSIPRALRWLLDPHDARFLMAACFHDMMLREGWPRTTSGAVFHEVLRTKNVGRVQRLAMFVAVSLWRWS